MNPGEMIVGPLHFLDHPRILKKIFAWTYPLILQEHEWPVSEILYINNIEEKMDTLRKKKVIHQFGSLKVGLIRFF